MALHKLGQQEQARKTLTKAVKILSAHLLQFGMGVWHDELICRILLDEAVATISKDEPHPER